MPETHNSFINFSDAPVLVRVTVHLVAGSVMLGLGANRRSSESRAS